MKNIVDEIRKVDNLYHANGCTLEQVHDAERELGLTFPKEFIDYVMEFGAISFYGTEWTGLNVGGYVNVVEAYVSRDFNNRFKITIALEKLVGWEGPYSNSAYNENARSMVNDVSSTVSRLGGSSRVSFTWR